MSVEEIVAKIDAERASIVKANRRIAELTESLLSIGDEEWDWVSVRKAAEFLDCSVTIIYRKIDNGTLHTRHVGAKTYVRRSELRMIDDRE